MVERFDSADPRGWVSTPCKWKLRSARTKGVPAKPTHAVIRFCPYMEQVSAPPATSTYSLQTTTFVVAKAACPDAACKLYANERVSRCINHPTVGNIETVSYLVKSCFVGFVVVQKCSQVGKRSKDRTKQDLQAWSVSPKDIRIDFVRSSIRLLTDWQRH